LYFHRNCVNCGSQNVSLSGTLSEEKISGGEILEVQK